ncbi:MAG: cell division protein ZipA [Aliidiomarina sp.]|uniref:cell division protein ZipA n=1 Tax=Aliidiomarina sp. TaxID=1872439 RepID=UPI0025BCD15E|nr:cell division protein ZipA [Aliidiomarina sp.]MCH8500573.1 cell division protein ZipA [Aliidiomarina sp.]
MDNLRVVLILAGVAIIIGLVVHGLWTLQKNNRNGKASRESLQRKRQSYDAEQVDLLESSEHDQNNPVRDFDELGVGRVKTRKRGERQMAEQVDVDVENSEIHAEETQKVETTSAAATDADDITLKASAEKSQPEEIPSMRAQRDDSAVEQLAIGLPETDDSDEIPEPPKEEVITLFVSGDIKGQVLLETVTELGMKFGDLDIFHRYEQPSGRGPLLFRMANMYNPGTFDLDNLENFTARGVVLFMTLPIKYDGHKAFTMMYNAANKIAEAMPRAAVLDANRNPMTKQSVQHTYQRIREFERRQRLAELRQS